MKKGAILLYSVLGSGHWIHLVRIKAEEKRKHEREVFFFFQSSEEFLSSLIPMFSKLFWMKTNLPANSYGCNIDQIKELMKQLVGSLGKGTGQVSHRLFLPWIMGVSSLRSDGAFKGTSQTVPAQDLTWAPLLAKGSLLWAWKVFDHVISVCPTKHVSNRKRSIYFTSNTF